VGPAGGVGVGRTCLVRRVKNLLRLLVEDEGQDLVEYALLGAFIGVVSVLVWQNIVSLLGQRYTDYNTNVPQLWEPPDPAPSGS
jgi:Flp pilus assembly pilin Flp